MLSEKHKYLMKNNNKKAWNWKMQNKKVSPLLSSGYTE